MSTYYFMLCKDCNETCNAASTSGTPKGPNVLIDSWLVLPKFLMFHLGCNLECISEADERSYSDSGMLEWSEENLEAMLDRQEPCDRKDRAERPWAYDPSIPRPGAGEKGKEA
jgi:hypothetical protein